MQHLINHFMMVWGILNELLPFAQCMLYQNNGHQVGEICGQEQIEFRTEINLVF